MKKLLFIIAVLWCAGSQAQTSYITATGYCIFEAGAIEEFNGPLVFVKGCYDVRQEIWTVTMGVSTVFCLAAFTVSYENTV